MKMRVLEMKNQKIVLLRRAEKERFLKMEMKIKKMERRNNREEKKANK